MVTIDEFRVFASKLPRSTEVLVRGRVKFRVGRIVYLAFSADGTVMGFAFPKAFREALVGSIQEALVLETSDPHGRLVGLTGNYVEVAFPGPDRLMRTLRSVRVTAARDGETLGEVVA